MGQTVVVATKQATTDFNMLKLNETAAFIWDAVAAGKDEQTIAQELANKYETTLYQAMDDTLSFINQLKELKIIE